MSQTAAFNPVLCVHKLMVLGSW